jgi:hypothetical protein
LVGELLGLHNTKEEVAKYWNHARVPTALYTQLDRSGFVFPFLSSLFSSNPWLSTVGTWLLQVIFSAFLLCVVIVATCMNPVSMRSNLRRHKNNNKKTPRFIPKELHACRSLIVALSNGWP